MQIKRQCISCDGTGLYVGMAERHGAAVVCYVCGGTGCEVVEIDYTPFTGRKERSGVRRVYRVNPGIIIGEGDDIHLEDFGGISHDAWLRRESWAPGTEMRAFTCPAWWCQAICIKRPGWKECDQVFGRRFSDCSYFAEKGKCWERYDREQLEAHDA